MSFTFNWPRFSDQFHYDAIQMLNTALNKGNKPPIIADKIEVVELEMGTQPPELEIRDIGDLTVDQFRGIFRLTYAGDAHLVLKTKVQANPLNHKQPDIHLMAGSRGMLAAKHPLVVPMLLRLSHFRLSSYVVLVVSKQKGITLVFKTDPLQNVDINSTFDSIAVIQNFIQREIEGQLRQMFREDLPGIIHRLSQQWVKAKVEAPYLSKRPPIPQERQSFDTLSTPSHRPIASDAGIQPHLSRKASSTSLGSRRPRSTSESVASASRPLQPPVASSHHSPPNESSTSSHPDLENFDPTYGLRPEGLPTKSVFKGFSSLFTPNKGLADLAEEPEPSEQDDDEEYDDDEAASFDFVDWGDEPVGTSPPSSLNERDREREGEMEYETIPAVGGGTITRPRVFHSQSAIQTHASANLPPRAPASALSRSFSQSSMGMGFRSGLATPALSMFSRHPSSASNPHFPEYPTGYAYAYSGPRSSGFTLNSATASVSGASLRAPLRSAPPIGPGYRPPSPESLESRSQPSRSSSGPTRTLSTGPTEHTAYDDPVFASSSSSHPLPFGGVSAAASRYAPSYPHARRPLSERRLSITSTTSTSNTHAEFLSTSPSHVQLPSTNGHSANAHAKIVLRPSLNDSIHQLSTLSHSNHTLSPYTRDLSHFTVRSVPPRGLGVGVGSGYGFGFGFGASGDRQPVKAKRKRTYRLGGQKKPAGVGADANAGSPSSAAPAQGQRPTARKDAPMHPSSPAPPSEFDAEDMDRYFRAHDYDEMPSSPSASTAHRPPPLPPMSRPLRPPPTPSSTIGGNRTLRQRTMQEPT